MKLLITLSYYSPYISGLTLSIKRLAELFVQSGYTVTILTTRHEKTLSLKEDINTITVVRVPYLFRISKGFIMPQFIYRTYKELHNVDSVLIGLPQAEGFIIAFLAKMLGRKVVCLYSCEVTLSGGLIAEIIEFTLHICNKMALSLADEIVTTTDDFAKHNSILKNKKIHEIYPVVIPPKINEVEKKMLTSKLPNKKYYIGFLGRIAHEKGLSYLLESIPLLQKNLGNEFIIILAGPKKTVGEENYQRKVAKLLKLYPDFVTQLGELKDEQIGAFYSLLDVFVLPSINNTEAFGMVQVEAMYCGTPVITTNLPGVRVPIQETGMGEIVKIQNSSALAEAIIKILLNKKKYIKPVEVIQKKFSIDKVVNEYQKLFNTN